MNTYISKCKISYLYKFKEAQLLTPKSEFLLPRDGRQATVSFAILRGTLSPSFHAEKTLDSEAVAPLSLLLGYQSPRERNGKGRGSTHWPVGQRNPTLLFMIASPCCYQGVFTVYLRFCGYVFRFFYSLSLSVNGLISFSRYSNYNRIMYADTFLSRTFTSDLRFINSSKKWASEQRSPADAIWAIFKANSTRKETSDQIRVDNTST